MRKTLQSPIMKRLEEDGSPTAIRALELLRTCERTVDPSPEDAWLGKGVEGLKMLAIMLIPIFLPAAVVLVPSYLFWRINAKREVRALHYDFSEGRLRISKEGFEATVHLVEIYRITDICVLQNWRERRVGIATLKLTVQDAESKPLELWLWAFGPHGEVVEYAEVLRQTVFALRTLPWVKGVIE